MTVRVANIFFFLRISTQSKIHIQQAVSSSLLDMIPIQNI